MVARASIKTVDGVSALTSSYSEEVLADSPLLYWRLNESSGATAADSSGNSRPGTYTADGTGAITYSVTGPITSDVSDTAVTLTPNGASNGAYVQRAASTVWDTTSMTFECWINPVSPNSNRYALGLVSNSNAGNQRWYLRINTDDLYKIVRGSAGGSELNTGVTATFGSWSHVVLTFDSGDSKWRLYIDGSNVYTSSADALGAQTNAFFTVGTNVVPGGTSGAEVFNGDMDEIALYGTALSSTRIAAHYAAA